MGKKLHPQQSLLHKVLHIAAGLPWGEIIMAIVHAAAEREAQAKRPPPAPVPVVLFLPGGWTLGGDLDLLDTEILFG